MPFVQISSNVARTAVALTPAMQAISKALASALSKPETVVMVHLNLDQPMLFAASDAVRTHSISPSFSHLTWHCMHVFGSPRLSVCVANLIYATMCLRKCVARFGSRAR